MCSSIVVCMKRCKVKEDRSEEEEEEEEEKKKKKK
jgi:hypothetical protein